MKIDHLVVNVDNFVQKDKGIIDSIHSIGLPYNPKKGKGTKGFKVSNIWIGNEYFEFISIKTNDGGGWLKDWTMKYHDGHRGLIGFCLEVDDIEESYKNLLQQNINVVPPKPLEFRWFFNLLKKTMPWRNLYLPEFQGVPFQFFLQQIDDEKTKKYMKKHMVPNSIENEISGISEVMIYGKLTIEDKKLLNALFMNYEDKDGILTICLKKQRIRFIQSDQHKVEVNLTCNHKNFVNKMVTIENLQIQNLDSSFE
ncbi:VOC family protein [Lysinibacillus sp. NPDC096418]|uniref:VOC family protein n=1 Tax=Lysinibacillus sp. NPDC096418 TaxID=3364138 RepID=UPI003821C8F4